LSKRNWKNYLTVPK